MFVGDRAAAYQHGRRTKEYIRNNNALTLGLIETYQIRSKKYVSHQNAEDMYHITRKNR